VSVTDNRDGPKAFMGSDLGTGSRSAFDEGRLDVTPCLLDETRVRRVRRAKISPNSAHVKKPMLTSLGQREISLRILTER
jgi:hypothetical protein